MTRPYARAHLQLTPVTLRAANAFVAEHHRHSKPVRGCRFVVGVASDQLHGVAIAGRPVARAVDDATVEILRVCTDGTRNACSLLYGACCRAAKAMGYRSAITYTLASEVGASLKASGFQAVASVKGRQWSCESRPRAVVAPVDKVRWERRL